MNRYQRKDLAAETLTILEAGGYDAPDGRAINLQPHLKQAIDAATLWDPPQLAVLLENRQAAGEHTTSFAVANETTLAAARRLIHDQSRQNVLCLNFASAFSPGGGFLNGSRAQEESLARSSALYPTLTANPEYYAANSQAKTAIYTDHMILSPDVPVFRTDDGALLDEPYRTTFLTAPAVNAGAVMQNEGHKWRDIAPTMKRRIGLVLALAEHAGQQHLVLGAWGCGVFRNDPDDIADLFAGYLLGDGTFAAAFASITFAVLDGDAETIIRPFRDRFDS